MCREVRIPEENLTPPTGSYFLTAERAGFFEVFSGFLSPEEKSSENHPQGKDKEKVPNLILSEKSC